MGCAASVQRQPVSFTRVAPSDEEAEVDVKQEHSVRAETRKPRRELAQAELEVKQGGSVQAETQQPEMQFASVCATEQAELEVKQGCPLQAETQMQQGKCSLQCFRADKHFQDRASAGDTLQGEAIKKFVVNANVIPEPSRAVSLNSYFFTPSSENHTPGRPLPPCAPSHVEHLHRLARALEVIDAAPGKLEDLITRRREIFDCKVKSREQLEQHQRIPTPFCRCRAKSS
eukprot:TRINITY_DN11497_c0_g1_i2.p1 TRINITY_DN11497_c0_g1~~TRINITY_DN11497_c0_g1_i2.p1  ORF type:complete len:230 (-),score=38.85 TRINITY_DN11497_c0_g1_i2:295-984(-)